MIDLTRKQSEFVKPIWEYLSSAISSNRLERGGKLEQLEEMRRIADLADIYGQIADELSSQYTVGYTSKNMKRDGAWRRLRPQWRRDGAGQRESRESPHVSPRTGPTSRRCPS